MSTAFTYQTDVSSYIDRASTGYNALARGVRDHLGGFSGKTVLDLGVGFQFPHGGITLALALADGAKRCFGIDIDHPELHSADPAKVEFWRQAQSKLGIEVQGLHEGRVVFASADILHFDEFFSRITLLQMSASDMWFKDGMFDIVISNAVFEHVKRPSEVMVELYRVLKPGGGASISWNPFAGLRMGGHDVGMPYYYPWAHLRLGEKEHSALLGKVFSDPNLYRVAFPPEHTVTPETAKVYAADPALVRRNSFGDLNRMKISQFLDYARRVGFEVVESVPYILEADRKYLTPEIRQELCEFSEEELLQMCHFALLRKPLSSLT